VAVASAEPYASLHLAPFVATEAGELASNQLSIVMTLTFPMTRHIYLVPNYSRRYDSSALDLCPPPPSRIRHLLYISRTPRSHYSHTVRVDWPLGGIPTTYLFLTRLLVYQERMRHVGDFCSRSHCFECPPVLRHCWLDHIRFLKNVLNYFVLCFLWT